MLHSVRCNAAAQVCGYFGWSECEYGSKCSCSMDFLGLFCFSWGCADKEL